MDSNLTKLRPLFVAQILYENTDEDHLMTIAEILQILHDKYGIDSYRTTIKTDVEMLMEAGLDIEFVKSSQNQYHIICRDFDIAELKILIDAVESAKFISKDKSQRLVEKISKLAGPFAAEKLIRNVEVERRIKPGNELLFLIVDSINEAINLGKQIQFQYFEYNVKKERKLKHDGKKYRLSPYRLIWNGDYYYVVGFSEKHNEIVSFRIDRMAGRPEILEQNIIPMPTDFDLDHHLNSMFHMFSTKRKHVELIVANDCMNALIDKFGEDIETYAYDMDSFRAEIDVATNKIFYTWIVGFEGKVQILGPDDVKEEYRKIVLEAARYI